MHGDLKPENLLLKMGPSGNKYDFIPVITDFGCSDFRHVDADGKDKRGLDRHGNQQYCLFPFPDATSPPPPGYKDNE